VVNIGARSLAYDDNGNLLSITDGTDVTSFEYDSRNLLTKWTAPDGTMATFVYDHDGNRVSRTIDGVTTKYIVDTADPSGLSQVVAEQDGSGSVEAGYVYGHDLISQDRGGTRSYYHADALGSTRALTNDAGEVTDTYAYGAFGDESNSTGSTTNEIRFTGEREDPTSLYHLRARYYDPEIARFLTRDPVSGDLTRPLTLNPYIYATNNPALLVDPSGEFVSVSIAISISISIAVVYFRFYKPAKDIADKLEELAVTIPNMRLNNSVTREELGLQWPAGDDGGYDAGNWINVGDGSVSKAYGIVNDLVSDTGKYVSAIHMFNSANWLKSLPSVELMVGEGADATPKQIPGGYVSCSFNHYVQTDFVLAIPSASLPGNGAAIVGTYMAYFTFLALMGSTIHQWAGTMDATLQPIEGGVACPGIGVD
jgi:RHS repeat-associated protein